MLPLEMKILLIDDHVLIREALRTVLREVKPDAAIVDAATWHQASSHIENEGEPQLVLLDLNLPDRSGLEVLGELRRNHPSICVVVLSGQKDRETVRQALEA